MELVERHCRFAILGRLGQVLGMTQPLALFLYEKLLPGGQLVNRLQDLGYRVHSLSDPRKLLESAEQEKPLLVIADLEPHHQRARDAISQLKSHQATAHIPVIA